MYFRLFTPLNATKLPTFHADVELISRRSCIVLTWSQKSVFLSSISRIIHLKHPIAMTDSIHLVSSAAPSNQPHIRVIACMHFSQTIPLPCHTNRFTPPLAYITLYNVTDFICSRLRNMVLSSSPTPYCPKSRNSPNFSTIQQYSLIYRPRIFFSLETHCN